MQKLHLISSAWSGQEFDHFVRVKMFRKSFILTMADQNRLEQ